MMIRPSEAVTNVTPYRAAAPRAGVLRLDATELPSAEDAIGRYPDARAFEAHVAEQWRIAPERVLATAGADEALDRAFRALLGPGREAIVPDPTFEMIPRYAALAGGRVVPVSWLDGDFPLDAYAAAVRASTALVVVVTPNNPTGSVAQIEQIAALARVAPHAVVLVDLAYVEFADRDPTAALLGLPNVVVVRTLSKAWGLAGLRVGYAMGTPQIVQWMRAAGGPYSVSGPSLALAKRRLGDARAVEETVARVREERAELEVLLRSLGAESLPSQANFVLVRCRDAPALQRNLDARGICVRSFPDRSGLVDRLRITCPANPRAFARLCEALRASLEGATQ